MRVELQERREGIEASYFLIVRERGIEQTYKLGRALKDTTFADSTRTPAHSECMSIAANLKAGYGSPTPTILQPFSRAPLEDAIVDGERANISPEKAKTFFLKILKILGQDGIQRMAEAGGKTAKPDFKDSLDKEYQRLFPYSRAA